MDTAGTRIRPNLPTVVVCAGEVDDTPFTMGYYRSFKGGAIDPCVSISATFEGVEHCSEIETPGSAGFIRGASEGLFQNEPWRIKNMHLSYRHELMKQTPPAPDCPEISMPLYEGNGNGEGAVADSVYRILALTFICFDRWLKPLFLQAERQNLSPIQEYDHYVKGLLRYLQNQRRDGA